jgi:histidinol-phosphatase (PHP family)
MLVDYHIHAAAHGEYKYSADWIKRFLYQAQKKGIAEIGFSEHEEFAGLVDLNAVQQAGSECKGIDVRLGLEADFIPGQEETTRKNILRRDYDYIIGSVHFIDQWGFDHPDFRNQFDQVSVDDVYHAYFKLVTAMVQSHMYDIVGHMDLIKLWGHRPSNHISSYITALLPAIKLSGMAVELNSAGLRKPVQEVYPAQEIINIMFDLNIPITFGSDAHHPDQVGEDFAVLVQMAGKAGYTAITSYKNRQPYRVYL